MDLGTICPSQAVCLQPLLLLNWNHLELLPQITTCVRQIPINEFVMILVFYEITKTNLTLAPGTYKAKNNNDVTGKGVFHVSKNPPVAVTINKTKMKETLML